MAKNGDLGLPLGRPGICFIWNSGQLYDLSWVVFINKRKEHKFWRFLNFALTSATKWTLSFRLNFGAECAQSVFQNNSKFKIKTLSSFLQKRSSSSKSYNLPLSIELFEFQIWYYQHFTMELASVTVETSSHAKKHNFRHKLTSIFDKEEPKR